MQQQLSVLFHRPTAARGGASSLYLKDDDYRLSFLYGSYLTLTNLTDADWLRIEQQRLTPLFVSVHATDPELRGQLLKNPRAGLLMDQVRWFRGTRSPDSRSGGGLSGAQ